jgi:hypothetical protein
MEHEEGKNDILVSASADIKAESRLTRFGFRAAAIRPSADGDQHHVCPSLPPRG